MKTPFFSIIVPIYNVENYLMQCCNSVLSQKFTDYELILINDGSTDSSAEICDSVKLINERVITIHKENEGLSETRNIGIEKAKGEYIIFLDSDDMLNSDALINLYQLITKLSYPKVIINRINKFTDIDLAGEDCQYYFEETIKSCSADVLFKKIIKNNDYLPGAWTLVTNREYIVTKNLYFVKGLLHEDEQWTPRVILKSETIGFNNHCMYKYRLGRKGSITQNTNVKRELDRLWIVENLYLESNELSYKVESKEMLKERAADLYWGVLIRLYNYRNNKKDFNQLITELNNKKKFFKMSSNSRYKITNTFSLFFGIKITSLLLYLINKSRNLQKSM